jgi:hypothetical protein
MYVLLNYKTAKKWKIPNYEYNKLNKIRYCTQLDKELVHTILSHEIDVTNNFRFIGHFIL